MRQMWCSQTTGETGTYISNDLAVGKGHGMVAGGQELAGAKEQSPKAEAPSVGRLTFFTAVGISADHPSDPRPANFLQRTRC